MKKSFNVILIFLIAIMCIYWLRSKVFALGNITFSLPSSTVLTESVFGTVSESGRYTFSSAPGSNVALSLSTNGQCEIKATSSSWATTEQTTVFSGSTISNPVSIRAHNDQLIEGQHTCSISYTATSDDAEFNGLSGSSTLTINDNDATPGFKFVHRPSSLTEGGPAQAYEVKLNDDAEEDVSITTSISGECQLLKSGKGGSGAVVESPNSYLISKGPAGSLYYNVRGVDDSKPEGNHTCTISHSVSTSDPNYSGKNIPSTTITVIDNDSSPSSAPASSSPESSNTSGNDSSEPTAQNSTIGLNSIKIGDTEIIKEERIVLGVNEPLKLSGITLPGAKIKLYVFSEPKEYTVTADQEGVWSIEISGLEPGEHHVEAELTDPSTGKTSNREQVLSFSVADQLPSTDIIATSEDDDSFSIMIVVAVLTAIFAIAVAYLYFFKREALRTLVRKISRRTPPTAPLN